jgi:hypothetical protein
MESIDMLVAFSLVAFFMLGVYFLSYYFAESSKQTEAAAASMLDAQEILKKILQSPGDPLDWTDVNQVNSLGLADPDLPGMLDSRKLMALANASGAACRLNAAQGDYPVTKVGYGIYVWGAPTPTSLDPSVYERILRSLFGNDWSKYDIELRIRPALKVAVTPAGSQVFVRVDPPGVYDVDICYVAWPGTPDVTTPISACASGQTGEDGRGGASVSGLSLFAYAYVRGVMLKGVNYTYAGSGTVSLIGLVAKPDAGIYVVHSRHIQNAGDGASLCGCDDPGAPAVGLRYLGVFLGGQSAPLYNDLTVNPGVSLDLNNVCGSGGDVGGCLVPWDKIGRAKFLIAVVSRDSQGQPPYCGGIPQNDIVVMPLAGGLPPLYEVHFATWRRWVDRRPEALAVSHASAVADAGEITYLVELWVFRYP